MKLKITLNNISIPTASRVKFTNPLFDILSFARYISNKGIAILTTNPIVDPTKPATIPISIMIPIIFAVLTQNLTI